MYNYKLPIVIFILVAAVQLYVPASMIMERENILTTGKEYKFKTAPVDPSDPFRGKYITLNYTANTVRVQDKDNWEGNETVYVLLSADKDGYAKIDGISKVKPAKGLDFVKAKVDYPPYDSTMVIEYPFKRYYMEESKAQGAETAYRESNVDSSHKTYALVKIKDGEAVLKDVMIDDISIREIVKARKNK